MLRANDGRRSDPTQRRGSCSRQRNFSLRSAICRTTPRSVSSGDGAERRECNSPHRRRVVKNSIAPGPVLRLAGPMSGFGTPRSRPRGRVAARPPLRVGARPRGVLGVQPTSRMTRQARLAAVAAAGGQLQGVAVAPRVVSAPTSSPCLSEYHTFHRNGSIEAPSRNEPMVEIVFKVVKPSEGCLLYTSPSPRDGLLSR